MGIAGTGELLVAVAALLITMSGIAYVFGDTQLTKRMVIGGIMLALAAPLFEASLVHLAKTAGSYAHVLLAAFVVAVVLVAFYRHGGRERGGKSRKPTSRKNRVD